MFNLYEIEAVSRRSQSVFLDPKTKMDGSLRGSQEADQCRFTTPRAPREPLWVDPYTVSNIGR